MRKLVTTTACAVAFFGALLWSAANQPVPTGKPTDIVLTEKNMVFLKGSINHDTISEAQATLADLDYERGGRGYPIFIVVRSPGGSVQAGMYLNAQLKGMKNVHYIMLEAFSMGAVLPQLHTGRRYVIESSTIMLHRIKMTVRESMDSEEVLKNFISLKATEDKLEKKIAARANMPIEQYRARTAKDWFLTSDEAIAMGFADEEVVVKCSKELIRAKKIVLVSPFPGLIPPEEVEKSKCPLLL